MTDQAEIEKRFWHALKSDRTLMLSLNKTADILPRPMTGLLDGDDERGPIWIFTSTENSLVENLSPDDLAIVSFASKGHDIFATLDGSLTIDNDRDVIDRLWNPFVAAWYEGGKDDPKLTLLRFEPNRAEIWVDGSSLIAGIKMLLGADPKEEYKDKVAKVTM